MRERSNKLDRTVARYLELISATRRPNTVDRYRVNLRLFTRHLRNKHPRLSSFRELRRLHIEEWLRDLATKKSESARPLQTSTRRLKIIMVRCFLGDIFAWGWNCAPKEALFRKGDAPPEDRLLPKPLSEDTDRALHNELRRKGGILPTALLLLRATGLRCQELLDLKVQSLEKVAKGRWALHVPLGKLHSERVVPVDAQAAELFHELCRLRRDPPPTPDPATGKPVDFLVAGRHGRPYSRWSLRRVLICATADAQVKEHVTPHRLRHTYATQMLRAGMSLPVLMKILGHRTMRMTMRYVEVTQQDVHRAYAEAMATIKNRYPMPLPVVNEEMPKQVASPQDAFLSVLRRAASILEAIRRDQTKGRQRKKRIQRLVERLQRIARDFRALRT